MTSCANTIRKYIPIIFICLLLVQITSAEDYPQLTDHVTDNANIIDNVYEQKIKNLAESIERNTTVEIAVLTIESLEGDSIDNYAINTFRKSGVGKKDNNNGLLILVAKNERKYRFEVGYGLEGTIPDAMKVPIGDKIITPNFKKGEYGKGIYESMVAIEALVTNNTDVISKYGLNQTGGDDIPWWVIVLVLIVIIVVIIVLMSISDSSGGGGFSGGGGGFGGGGFSNGSGGGDSGGGGFGGGSSGGGGFGGGW